MMRSPTESSSKKRYTKEPLKGVDRLDRLRGVQEKPKCEEQQGGRTLRGMVSANLSQELKRLTGVSIGWIPSPNFSERNGMIDTVVLHYTVTGSLEETVDLFQKGGEGASAHYVIGKDGLIIQMVDVGKKALHAGASEFHGRPDVNDISIGIELVNWGLLKERNGIFFAWPGGYQTEYHGQSPVYAGGEWWEPFTEIQYRVLAYLIGQIRVHCPLITPDRIVGHRDIALPWGRKIDPGLAFDWDRVRKG